MNYDVNRNANVLRINCDCRRYVTVICYYGEFLKLDVDITDICNNRLNLVSGLAFTKVKS